MTKRIGLLTSGGDCPGLNAAIRAVVHRAVRQHGWRVFGIRQGTTGLIKRPLDYIELTPDMCDVEMMRQGGTILGSTNKDNPFYFPLKEGGYVDRSDDFFAGYRELGLDALIGIGGDGSMKILNRLSELGGLNLVTIPKTIDNDVSGTENAIGYLTAVAVATEALDRLQPTAASHQRVMILEVMGRDAGHIALASGVAGGADIILIPEIPYSLEKIQAKINSLAVHGANCALIIVAEGLRREDGQPLHTKDPHTGRLRYGGIGHYLSEKLTFSIGADVRVTVLGHVQRGGQPCAEDRILASKFGAAAVGLIAEERFGRMVALKGQHVHDISISDAVATQKLVGLHGIMMQTARGLGICFGDDGL